jgi:hypothetical protein
VTYQVDLISNSPDGFRDAELEAAVRERAAAINPALTVERTDLETLELRDSSGLLATLCPAGEEPFDYLLVDFVEHHGWDQSAQIRIVAEVGEALNLTVLELESRLEYSPGRWAQMRGRYHSPDPARRSEARQIELEREIEFYERRGLPFTSEEVGALQLAAKAPDNTDLQRAARLIREKKHREDRPAVPVRSRRYNHPTDRVSWWPFGRRRG